MAIIFHWGFVTILAIAFALSATFRARARRTSGTIARREEGVWAVVLRAVLALPLFLSFTAFAINPDWMQWSFVPLPNWLRWTGLAIGALCVFFLWWVFASIGSNISETILTKKDHQLVTDGPYHRIRHPLYSGALLAFFSLSLVASNTFMAGLVVIGAILFVAVVIPREEDRLIAKFGEAYLEYRKSTGRLLPRMWK